MTDLASSVATEEHERTLVITFSRPDARNAMTLETGQGIAAALDELDRRNDLAVGVITGGGNTFCAGMDLKRFAAGESAAVPGRGFAGLTLAPPAKPLIAAVEGYALGGGLEMVLACDLAIAGHGARFGLPEVKRGLIARGGGVVRLPQRIPRAVALELMLTGTPISATRAYRLGLINRVTADGGALAEALTMAAAIAANSPTAVIAAKRIAVDSAGWAPEEWQDRQRALADQVMTSPDAKEGPRAFVEKRTPNWPSYRDEGA
jgi:enoyl-CoA hydratase